MGDDSGACSAFRCFLSHYGHFSFPVCQSDPGDNFSLEVVIGMYDPFPPYPRFSFGKHCAKHFFFRIIIQSIDFFRCRP